MGDVRPGAQVGGCAVLQDVVAMAGVLLHHLEFVRRELAGLEQDAVGNRHLADVVQRCGLGQLVDEGVGQFGWSVGLGSDPAGQCAHVFLGALDVVAGVRIAELGQADHHKQRRVAQPLDLAFAGRQLAAEVGVVAQQLVLGELELQMGAHPGHDGRRVEGLVDEIGTAGLETGTLVRGPGQGRQEDDRHPTRGRVGLELAADLVAVHLGHHHVQHDQIGWLAAADLQRLGSADRELDPELRLEHLGQQGQIGRRVVDDQHGGLRGGEGGEGLG
mmetsp:Transcript_61352/g.150989  ORF Transcript_61352/g.150989 Transcript_61352/m.150989 type:complete len:274 (+) Transcript_61352:275-1096(+)